MELYKKYRPKDFDEVFGNETVVKSIKSKLESGNLPHFIIFDGQPGCGKCITGDSIILTENGFSEIQEFSSQKNGFTEMEAAVNDGRDFAQTSHFFQELTDKTVKIETDNGFELEGTPEHPVLVLSKSCDFEFKKLAEIETGDFVCVPKGMNVFPKENKKFDFVFHKHQNDANSVDYKIPEYPSVQLAKFVGYMVANGITDANAISFSTKNIEIRQDFFKVCKEVFGLSGFKTNYDKDSRKCCVKVTSFLRYLSGGTFCTARYKTVPKFVMQGTKDIQISFLEALFDCDGADYSKSTRVFEYSTASAKLAKTVQMMLLNLGIVSTLKKSFLQEYNWAYNSIYVRGDEYAKLFDALTGVIRKPKAHLRENRMGQKNFVPYAKDFICNTINSNKGGYYVDSDLKSKRAIGYQKDRELRHWAILKLAQEIQAKGGIKYTEQILPKLNTLLGKNYHYSKVVKKEVLNEQKLVYDFTIPSTHQFFSNGVISHNTTLSRILKEKLDVRDMDFNEINAADANGVEVARLVSEKCQYKPLLGGKCRLWLFDEAHRLTAACQAAMLKVLEDCPKHAYFIFASSEASKLSTAIKSRATMFTMKPLNDKQMTALLNSVCEREELEIPEEAIDKIVEFSNGQSRNALVALDNIKDLDKDKMQDAIERTIAQESKSFDLLKALLWGKGSWQNIAMILKDFEEDSEQTRRYLLTCACNQLKDPSKAKTHGLAAELAFALRQPTYNNGMNDLILSLREFWERAYQK